MNEQYVSFEIAKLLKEKGFDWPTIEYYSLSGGIYRFVDGIADICGISSYPRPTQQMACRWLREEHEIDIIPIIRHSLKYAQESPFRDYACRVYDCDGNIVLSATKWYSRYESAIEVALEYVLKNLI